MSVANSYEYKGDSLRYMIVPLPDDPKLLKMVSFEPKISYNIPIEENEYGWDKSLDKEYAEEAVYYGY